MKGIYRNVYVTISTAKASDCSSGFLQKRNKWSEADQAPNYLPYRSPDGALGTIGLYQHSDPALRDPIHGRAWTMQEHLLSPRLLVYGTLQLFWICRSKIGQKAAQAVSGIRANQSELEAMHRLLAPVHRLDQLKIDNRCPSRLEYVWTYIMEEFSSCKLNNSMNKLTALSGIVTRFQGHVHDEYLAGHWKRWFLPHYCGG